MRISYLIRAGAMLAVAVSTSALANPNLVTNGDFSTGLTGWTVTSDPNGFDNWASDAGNASGDNAVYSNAYTGANTQAQYGAGFGPSFISQTLTGLTPGQSYFINFDVASNDLTANAGPVENYVHAGFGNIVGPTVSDNEYSLSGPLIASVSNVTALPGQPNWEAVGGIFTATSASQTLTFEGIDDPGLMHMTDIDVQATPEPFTMTLLGASAVGGFFRMRNRSKKS